MSCDNYPNIESTYIDILNTNIKHSSGSKITYNEKNRTIKFHQNQFDDWFLLTDVKINNLSFEMISNLDISFCC